MADQYDPLLRLAFLKGIAREYRDREVFVHYKGGVYVVEFDGVPHTETGEIGVVQRHLWPHSGGEVKFRPSSVFHGLVRLRDFTVNRYERVDFDSL